MFFISRPVNVIFITAGDQKGTALLRYLCSSSPVYWAVSAKFLVRLPKKILQLKWQERGGTKSLELPHSVVIIGDFLPGVGWTTVFISFFGESQFSPWVVLSLNDFLCMSSFVQLTLCKISRFSVFNPFFKRLHLGTLLKFSVSGPTKM